MTISQMRVMLALDHSTHSEYALDSVLLRPWPTETEFLVFSVFEPYHPDFAGWDENAIKQAMDYAEGLQADSKTYTESCAAKLGLNFPGSKVSAETKESPKIKETIIQKAIDWEADLIVMGSHGRTGFERFLLGSVSQAVLAHAPCSVEIVKRALRQPSG